MLELFHTQDLLALVTVLIVHLLQALQRIQDLKVAVVADKAGKKGAALSGLKTEITRRDDGFNERALGYGGFLQFCKAAAARDLVSMAWDDARGDYLLSPAG